MIQDVDARGDFGRMGCNFDGVESDWLIKRYCDFLRVIAEALRLPRRVFSEEVADGEAIILAGEGLYAEAALHGIKLYFSSGAVRGDKYHLWRLEDLSSLRVECSSLRILVFLCFSWSSRCSSCRLTRLCSIESRL